MQTITYHSKIDSWFLMVVILSSLVLLWSFLKLLTTQNSSLAIIIVVGLSLLLGMACLWVPLFTTKYVLNDKTLYIQSFFVKENIHLASIQSVQAKRSFISSPALSIDRVEIKYKENNQIKTLYISPKERATFIALLLKKSYIQQH